MKLEFRFPNCFWLLTPLLIWNILLSSKITLDAVISDAHSPGWLLIPENIIRTAVFILSLFISLQVVDRVSKTGFFVYLTGILVYFASWLPLILAPQAGWSTSSAGLLAPRLTPLIPFMGITLIGNSWFYAGLSSIFLFLHTWHGIQNL